MNLSGHSLRIGGATEALIGGMTELQIRVMGDGKSDAYMRYLRGVEPAAGRPCQKWKQAKTETETKTGSGIIIFFSWSANAEFGKLSK